MKKGLILVILLILIPIAGALELESINKSVFNLGDNIEVKGNIQTAFKGGFRINLNCGNVVSLMFKNVTLGENAEFNEAVKLYNGEGDCNIGVSLETKDGIIDYKDSNKFRLSRDINSSFFSEKEFVAKGESLRFGGTVKKISGLDFSGLITITIEGASSKEVFTKDINNEWDFDFDTVNRPIGVYRVSVKYQDLYGNGGEFKDVIAFKISNKIDFAFDLGNGTYSPSETVPIKGIIKNFKGDPVSGKVKIIFLDKITTMDVNDGNLAYDLKLEDNQASGDYNIGFKVEDDFGNYGERGYSFSVRKVPKSLLVFISKSEFLPKEEVNAQSKVLDQTGNEITEGKSVNLIIFDAKGKQITEWTNELNYDLDQFALPGRYTIEGKFEDLTEKSYFSVIGVESLEVNLVNQSILFFNNGNVVYNKQVEIVFKGEGENKFFEIVELNPGESRTYPLNDKVKSGTYTIFVLADGKDYSFDNLLLEDKRSVLRKTGNLLTGAVGAIGSLGGGDLGDTSKNILLVIVVLALIFFFIVNRQNKLLRQIGWYIKHLVENYTAQGNMLNTLKKAVKSKGKEKKKVMSILNKYLDTHIARELIHKDKLGLDSEKREISVMFTDIRDFTTLVSSGDPWVVMNMVNYYFKSVTDIIYKYHGTINKYLGDSVMALFNAPRKVEGHLLMALKAGVEISKELNKLNMKLKEKGINEISVGIGISSGEALIGSFGDKFMEYSALGNCVNLASRIQAYGTGNHVLIDEKTYEKVKDKVDVVEHGTFDIRGIGRMKVYNVTDVKGEY